MTLSPRPRRSVLYMPGSNGRALAKARELPADCLIMDLEDAVAPEAKAAARAEIAAALQAGGYGRPRSRYPSQCHGLRRGSPTIWRWSPEVARTPYCCPKSNLPPRSTRPCSSLRPRAPRQTCQSGSWPKPHAACWISTAFCQTHPRGRSRNGHLRPRQRPAPAGGQRAEVACCMPSAIACWRPGRTVWI